jgi:hypothetical protein
MVTAISILHPTAQNLRDYELRDDGGGVYIDVWNLKDEEGNDIPQPTIEELQEVWEAYVPPVPPETPQQKIERLEIELESAKAATLDTMDAVFDLYLMLLDMQSIGGDPA